MQGFGYAKQKYDESRARSKAMQTQKRERILSELPEIEALRRAINLLWIQQIEGTLSEQQREDAVAAKTAQINKILHEHGYAPEDLEIRPICPLCEDSGYHNGVICNCLKQAFIDECYAQSNLTSVLEVENFLTFDESLFSEKKINGNSPRQRVVQIRQRALNFVAEFETGTQHLLFVGGVGTGKTFLSHCVAKELLDRGRTVVYFTAYDLIEKFTDITMGRTDRAWSELIWESDLIILDDLGSERSTEFAQNVLFNLINERIVRNKKMLISTNLSMTELKEHYNNRIFSRLIGYFEATPFIGDDLRMTKKTGMR